MSALAADFEPMAAMACGRRADEHDAGARAGGGELRVLREKPVAGMDGLRAGAARGVENDVTAQITFLRARAADVHGFIAGGDVRGLRVGVGVHRDGADSQSPARCARRGRRSRRGSRSAAWRTLRSYFFGAQEGARFSRNAAMPSRPSGDTRASAMHFAVAASNTSSMGISTTSASRRLVAASAAGLAASR